VAHLDVEQRLESYEPSAVGGIDDLPHVRHPQRRVERPGQRGAGGLVAGHDQADHLVPDLGGVEGDLQPVADHLAVGSQTVSVQCLPYEIDQVCGFRQRPAAPHGATS
jgi:hypothetical protein